MHTFRRDEVVLLLGAGASVDAGIPHSSNMVSRVESLVSEGGEWEDYRELYNFLKGSILYGDGIQGHFGNDVNYNIERVVNTLDELKRKEEHPLYPYVGSWTPKLLEVAGDGFNRIRQFRDSIVKRLRTKWLAVDGPEPSAYYANLESFQEQYQHQLRVFTLNYDRCVEDNCSPERLERGFDENKIWKWGRFENEEKDILLYKLHGSTDWYRKESGELTYRSKEFINDDEVEIIFGTAYKLQYLDPFLYFASELRKWTLDSARLIIAIGYGFGDDHVNGILGQALRRSQERNTKLFSVAPLSAQSSKLQAEERIRQMLNLNSSDQVVCYDCRAQTFMEDHMDLNHIAQEAFDEEAEEELFEEVKPSNQVGDEYVFVDGEEVHIVPASESQPD